MSVDPALQMFISACCATCRDMTCEGALVETTKRTTCQKYLKWLILPASKRAKLFMEATAGEILLLEDLINE